VRVSLEPAPLLESPLAFALRAARRVLWRYVYTPLVRRRGGVVARGRLHLRGRPMIEVVKGARVVLGDGVMLNSANEGYHLNLYGPTRLVADKPGAEIVVGDGTRLHGTCVHAYLRVEIGRNCLVAGNVQIIDGSGHDLCMDDPARRVDTRGSARAVAIGDNVWIGAHCFILPGTTIGEGTVVAAGSVVSGELPPRVLAGGNPARVLRDYRAEPAGVPVPDAAAP
jgi:carbonic anhydrase/acetyltransferase-like protein (isoleucine patch superfamily)